MQKQVSREVPATSCAEITTAHNGMVIPGQRGGSRLILGGAY